MVQIQVQAEKLNKRKVIPGFLPDPDNIAGVVFKNKIIEAEEIIDVPNPGLGKWYKDRDGYFYWGGGVKEIDFFAVKTSSEQTPYPWWLKNAFYSIPDLWAGEDMPKVTIAILDTGITEHIDFDFNKIAGFNYIDKTTDYKTDSVGHGTHLAGIIAAKGIKSSGIIPGVNLFIAKVCDNSGTPSLDAVKNALNDILNNLNGASGIDVINMSFNLAARNNDTEQKLLEDITTLLKRISQEQCVLVSACGDEDWEFENFPACLDECISVGSIDQGFKRSSFSTKSLTLDIMSPGENIISSMAFDSTIIKNGTSQSSAIISAICALGIRELKRKGEKNTILLKKALFQTAINNSFSMNEYGHGICNPNNFIKTIKSV
ncbi:MAG: S8 family peptidase [Sphingobacteriales bacterium]